MREGDMPIDLRCCLRAAVAVREMEIEGCNSMLAEGAFERRAAIHRFGCVISHSSMVVLLLVLALGNRCATLGQHTTVMGGKLCFSSLSRRAAFVVRWRGETEKKLVQL
jgi:hypothetical protein